jgi:hypothetical protein
VAGPSRAPRTAAPDGPSTTDSGPASVQLYPTGPRTGTRREHTTSRQLSIPALSGRPPGENANSLPLSFMAKSESPSRRSGQKSNSGTPERGLRPSPPTPRPPIQTTRKTARTVNRAIPEAPPPNRTPGQDSGPDGRSERSSGRYGSQGPAGRGQGSQGGRAGRSGRAGHGPGGTTRTPAAGPPEPGAAGRPDRPSRAQRDGLTADQDGDQGAQQRSAAPGGAGGGTGEEPRPADRRSPLQHEVQHAHPEPLPAT